TCNTPTSLTASNLQPTTADAAWASVTNANSYNVRYKPATSSVWTTTTTTIPSKTITGLSAFTIYNIQTQAVCSNTQSAYTTSTNFTTPSTPTCNAPSSIAASTIGSTTATIGWTANSAAASGYTVQYKPSSSTTWTTVSSSSNSLNLTGLSTSTAYDVKVMSNCSASSTSAYSAVVNFTTLAPSCPIPTNVGNSSLTINSINLTWTATTGASSYTIQYKPSTSTTWTTTTSSTNSKLLTSLSSGTQYNVQVMASCASSNSAYAAVYTFTTPADCGVPTNVAVSSITSTSATATWTAISSATSYTIQYKLATATVWSSTTSTTANKALSGLTAGTTYNVKVMPSCGTTYSAITNFTTLSTATCSTPNAPTVSSITANGATATWTAVSGASSYTIQYKLASATTWSSANSTTASYTLSGLTASSTYSVQVMTVCSSGNSTYSIATSFTTAAATTTSCSIPTGLTVSGITTSGATATWTAVSGATNYTIQYRLSTSTVWSSTSSTTTSKSLTGLVSGSIYEVKVRSNCSSGSSAYSSAVSFSTPTNSAGTQEGYDILSFESACDISNDASHIWIDKVEVGDMLNESGSNDGYADFSMLTAEVERNTKLPVHFKTAYWNIETPQHWAVWIDFNHDKVFDNVTEQVLQIQTNGNELYTSIYIAKDVPIGETLMRISLNTQNQVDACTSGEGETEDYHITITDYKATNFVPIIEPLWLSSVSLNQTSCKNIAEMAYSINDELNFIAYKGQENLLRFTTNRYAAYIVWVDYNGNGEFESTELISEGEGNGDFLLNLNVPFDAITGTSALLISIEGDDLSDVEQYALTIVEGNPANPPMAYTECKEIDVQLDYSVTGNEVSMRNLSTGVYDQVVWDMGDGTQLNSPNAAHYYELPGNYQFSLSMINTELGCEKMFKGEVRVFGE
ncbi:MAG TPA: fibronectin type III domain-containing protein, partial [Chitinophagales bacterium]|nr:fibronectin type III domain-containing protein [Chitinophagales bacterium]